MNELKSWFAVIISIDNKIDTSPLLSIDKTSKVFIFFQAKFSVCFFFFFSCDHFHLSLAFFLGSDHTINCSVLSVYTGPRNFTQFYVHTNDLSYNLIVQSDRKKKSYHVYQALSRIFQLHLSSRR